MDRQLKELDFLKILATFIFGSFLAFPLRLSNYSMIHGEGLSIQFSKSSPPLAVIEDEKISVDEAAVAIPSLTAPLILKATATGAYKLALKIAAEFAQQQKEIPQAAIEIIPQQTRQLAGMTLSKGSQNIQLIKKSLGIQTHEIHFKQVKALPIKTNRNIAKAAEPVLQTASAQPIALEQEAIADYEASQNPNDYFSNEPESFDEKANRLVNQAENEIRSAPIRHREKSNQNKNGVHFILVGSRPSANTNDQASRNFANNALINPPRDNSLRRNPSLQPRGNDPMATDPEQTVKGLDVASRSPAADDKSLFANPPKQALIAGNIEFTNGLAMTGNQKISVYRQVAGSKVSAGKVTLNKGLFEIYVDNPSTGMIVADMVEGNQIVGRGELLLADALKATKTTGELKSMKLTLKPVADQIQTTNADAYSYYQKSSTINAKTTINDNLDTKTKIYHSIVINKAEKQNYWGSIAVGSSTQFFKNILYPDDTIKALKDIVGATLSKSQSGVIRGIVKVMGSPVSDAKVEISVEGNNAVYFNSFIPDPTLQATTANGEYAFVGVPEGMYVVKANYNGHTLSPQIVPVESGFVTKTDFDVQKPSLAEAFVFDMKNSEMMNAQIGFVGSDRFANIQGKKLLSFSGSEGVQFLEARSDDQNYYTTRVTVDKSDKEILVPMIEQNWLNELVTRLRVNMMPDSAVVMGTAPETSYQIELDPKAYNDDTKIIYFDRNGYTAQGATSVPVGGGFIVLNINPGMRSLFVHYEGQDLQKVVTMAADSSAINVFVSKY